MIQFYTSFYKWLILINLQKNPICIVWYENTQNGALKCSYMLVLNYNIYLGQSCLIMHNNNMPDAFVEATLAGGSYEGDLLKGGGKAAGWVRPAQSSGQFGTWC